MNKTTEALKLAEEALEEYDKYYGRNANQALALKYVKSALLAESVKHEPVSMFNWRNGSPVSLRHAAPVDAKAIRAEALEEAAIAGGAAAMAGLDFMEVAAAIRGLK